MTNLFEKVLEFHKAFKLPIATDPHANSSAKSYELRYALMREENKEYLKACEDKDLTEIADALGDQFYVLIGTCITHGIGPELFEKVFNEIHRSNMSKLDENGQPLYKENGKVAKSNLYSEPDIKKILENK